jgi:hypothetical protein
MRTSVFTIFLGIILLLVGGLTASAQVKIMPLGDSITKGAGDPSGYRGRLFDDLKAANVKFQFVGCTDINSSPALFAAGQQFHNGYGTWRTDSLLANFEATKQQGDGDNNMGGFWFSGAPGNSRAPVFPDIVLLLTGANDLGQGATDQVLESRLSDLLKWFEVHRPRTQVFVGTVLPRGPAKPDFEKYNVTVGNVNKWLATRVDGMGAHFHLVDLGKLFMDGSGHVNTDATPDGVFLQDGIHPNHKGYVEMGDAWFQAIKPYLNTSLGDSGWR